MYNKRELTEEEKTRRLDKMIENWKKSSKDNFREKEHTKSDSKKKKKESAEKRKINAKKRSF